MKSPREIAARARDARGNLGPASDRALARIISVSVDLGNRARSASRTRTAIVVDGLTLALSGRSEQYLQTYDQARACLEADLHNLGVDYKNRGKPAKAIGPLRWALAVERVNDLDQRRVVVGEGTLLPFLAQVCVDSGHLIEADRYLARWVSVLRESGDGPGELSATERLSYVQLTISGSYSSVPWLEKGIRTLEGQLALSRDLGDTGMEAMTLLNLGVALMNTSDRGDRVLGLLEEAIAVWEGRAAVDPEGLHMLVRLLRRLGSCLMDRDEAGHALAPLQRACELSRELECRCHRESLRG